MKVIRTTGNLPTIEELAADAFNKNELVMALSGMSTPLDYKERKKAFIDLQLARKKASEANYKLEQALRN